MTKVPTEEAVGTSFTAGTSSSPNSPGASSPAKASTTPKKRKNGLPQIPEDLQYDESRVLPVDDEHIDILIENAGLEEPLLNGWSIYDHQKEGVLRALRMRRLILVSFVMHQRLSLILAIAQEPFMSEPCYLMY